MFGGKRSIFMFRGSELWFWLCHFVQNHPVIHENCWHMFELSKTFVWKNFWKTLLLKIGHFKAFLSPLLTTIQRLFLEKLNIFRFSSIKFFWSVVWPFWSWGKIALSLENIPGTQKVCLDYLAQIFWSIFKYHIFPKKHFFTRVCLFFIWKC